MEEFPWDAARGQGSQGADANAGGRAGRHRGIGGDRDGRATDVGCGAWQSSHAAEPDAEPPHDDGGRVPHVHAWHAGKVKGLKLGRVAAAPTSVSAAATAGKRFRGLTGRGDGARESAGCTWDKAAGLSVLVGSELPPISDLVN